MGRISLEHLVATVEKSMECAQMEAREKITQVVTKARKEDPSFFALPYNPFNLEDETDSDEDDETESENRSKIWFSALKASTGPTAKELLKIKKELYSKIQQAMDEFRAVTSSDITPSPPFAPLYCRILQLEYII